MVRFFLLSTHYRSPWTSMMKSWLPQGGGLERIRTSIRLLREALARAEEGEGDPKGKQARVWRKPPAKGLRRPLR